MKKASSQSVLIRDIIFSFFTAFRDWIKAGNPPPRTHRKSMFIMTALLVFGFTFLTVWILAVTGTKFYTANSIHSFAIMAFITLCPGLWALWNSVCSWRRVKGYDWGMIPFFD